jgi:hypothetical protein
VVAQSVSPVGALIAWRTVFGADLARGSDYSALRPWSLGRRRRHETTLSCIAVAVLGCSASRCLREAG